MEICVFFVCGLFDLICFRYTDRKVAVEKKLMVAVSELSARHSFCKAVVDGSLVLFGKTRGKCGT
jgi:hypothetical protein